MYTRKTIAVAGFRVYKAARSAWGVFLELGHAERSESGHQAVSVSPRNEVSRLYLRSIFRNSRFSHSPRSILSERWGFKRCGCKKP